jgi:hypothetical protein
MPGAAGGRVEEFLAGRRVGDGAASGVRVEILAHRSLSLASFRNRVCVCGGVTLPQVLRWQPGIGRGRNGVEERAIQARCLSEVAGALGAEVDRPCQVGSRDLT